MTYSRQKIDDDIADLPHSRQYKWMLRHPEKQKKLNKRYRQGETYKAWYERTREKRAKYQKEYQKKLRERKLNASQEI